MPSIRTLSTADSSEWLRMRRTLWPDCSGPMHECEMAEIRATPQTHTVFVYERDTRSGLLGGFVEISIRDRVDGSLSPRVAYIQGWYVDPDLRGHRIGRQLIEAAEQWAIERGLTEIASDCELENISALAAHQALGFQEPLTTTVQLLTSPACYPQHSAL